MAALRIIGLDVRFLEDDLALASDLVRIELRAEDHVGEGLQRHLRGLAGDHDVEVGVVERGCRVGATTDALDGPIDAAGSPLVRALEQHVLLEVRVAELIRPLVAHAHAHVEIDGDDVGGAMVLDDQPETVGQHLTGPAPAGTAAGAGLDPIRPAQPPISTSATTDASAAHRRAWLRSTHWTFPVKSSTRPARSTVSLNGLPAGLLASRSRIFVRLTASAWMPSTDRMMSPPSGT